VYCCRVHPLQGIRVAGSEHGWRLQDVEDVVAAAQAARLATIGGQVQYQLPNATCEPYWLSYDASDRRTAELWVDYVERSATGGADQVQAAGVLRRTSRGGDGVGANPQSNREGGLDPLAHLWFMLYFKAREPE